ncbi:MAG: amino acid ABC transporter permease [Solobacterium sp.]|nr:amino acid ABC transporter permease [Solobacterium sp.]
MSAAEQWELFLDSFWKILIPGLKMTLPLTIVAFALSIVVAVIVAMIQYAKVPILSQICRFYIWIIRGTPLMVQLAIGFYGLNSIGIKIAAFPAAVLVFTLNEGAYCAETMRGALEAVPIGQIEAGYCVGMNYAQIMWHVVLPQAFRVAFPSLGNALISMVKDTSLASNITYAEMFMATKRIAGKTYQFMLLYVEVALIYLLFSTVLSWLQRYGEKKLDMYGVNR